MSSTDPEAGVIVLNPASGDASHAEVVRDRAALLGYEVRETEAAGDGVTIAREAAGEGVPRVVAAGGDGTLNEVVRGVDRAGAFDRVTLGVVPAGTGNNFAGNVGIPTMEEGFRVLVDGEARRIDLGRADDRTFVNSCVAGLTADASADTSPEMKRKYGVLAYVMTTARTASSFDGLRLSISTGDDGNPAWAGEAVCVFVGNGRRFPTEGGTQADVEDGCFDVTVVEEAPALDLVEEAAVERLFDRDEPHTTRFQAPHLEITGRTPDPVDYSLDGEMIRGREVSLDVEPRTLEFLVGDGYDPDPGG